MYAILEYLHLVIDTISDIFLFNSLIITFYFFLLLFLIYLTFKNIHRNATSYKYLILISRFLVLVTLLPLFENKNIPIEQEVFNKKNIGLIIDDSKSMKSFYDSKLIHNYVDSIKFWESQKSINLSIFNLDSIMNMDDFTFEKEYTSFEEIPYLSSTNNLNEIIFMTDGNVNYGSNINFGKFNDKIKINVIGFGENESNKYVSINDIKLLEFNDSTFARLIFDVKTNNHIKLELEAIDFNSNEKLFLDTLNFEKGVYYNDLDISLTNIDTKRNLHFRLLPINFINSSLSSDFIINGSEKKINILLLTGAYNYNTSFIKSILKSNSNFDFFHKYYTNDIIIKENEYDLIIIDNFYDNSNHYDFLNKIEDLNEPIIFFDGVNDSRIFLANLLQKKFDEFKIEKNQKEKNIILNNSQIGSFLMNYTLFSKNTNQIDVINYFNDKTPSILGNNNFSVVFLPNIGELNFYYSNQFNNYDLFNFFDVFIKKQLNEDLITINSNKKDFKVGEKILINNINSLKKLDYEKYISIYNIKENIIDTVEFISNDIVINEAGKYEIKLIYKGTNQNYINSNSINVNVNELISENYNSYKNINFLKNISSSTNGKYIDSENFNLNFLNDIDFKKNAIIDRNILSALDLFINGYIFIIVIVLFAFEIYVRKRIGLL